MLPSNAADARRLGSAQYFTGKPCKHGHVAPRQTINGTCMECARLNFRRWVESDPDHAKSRMDEARAAWMERNPGWVGEQYAKHRDKKIAASTAWNQRNSARSREHKKTWKRRNPEAVNAWAARRAAQIGKATPWWLTPEQHDEMAAIYREARARGPEWHVDHIVPLNGKTVCGLHVPWNLQILPASENAAKGNRLLEEAA